MNAPLTIVDRAIAATLEPCDSRDVRLYAYSRRTASPGRHAARIDMPLPIVTMSSVLKQAEHFSTLLTAGFSEEGGTAFSSLSLHEIARLQAGESEYDYEYDSDLDEAEAQDSEEDAVMSPTESDHTQRGVAAVESFPAQKYTILIPNMAFKTLRACVFYLYTGKVHFLTLSSGGATLRGSASLAARQSGIPACSPKSLYRLADAYGMKDLQDIALNGITSSLTSENIVQECFSIFFSMYDEPRHQAMVKLRKLYDHPKVQEVLPGFMAKLVAGELPHATAALQELVAARPVSLVDPQEERDRRAMRAARFGIVGVSKKNRDDHWSGPSSRYV